MNRLGLLCAIGLSVAVLSGCSGSAQIGPAKPPATTPPAKDVARAPAVDKDAARDGGRKAMMDEPRVGVDRPAPKVEDVPAGVLTAGSFDDNLHPQFFRSFAGKVGQNPHLGDLPGKLLGQRLEVRVRNDKGQPVGNARVRLAGAETTTRSDGRAVFLLSWDRIPEQGELEVTASLPGRNETATQRIPWNAPDCTVLLASPAPLPRNLDLAFVLDTTGSMGDELRFLKAEIKSIAAAVRKQFPDVNQRYALVLYRDQGDEYVTRTFDFTASIDEFQRNLAAQSAAGGGDLPEALHKGLEEATQLRWREADTARVLFVVADAPPHRQDAVRTLEQVDRLRRRGVAVYPIAASNTDAATLEATEFHLRAAALLTGGQYLFLTDDSGVGEAHGEPRIPYYAVEMLDKLMVRMIAGELAGRRTDPDPKDVLRTVGKPPRGRQD